MQMEAYDGKVEQGLARRSALASWRA